MTTDGPTPMQQRQAMAQAIRALRLKPAQDGTTLSVSEAARRAGIQRQTWENYEKGERHAVLRADLQDTVARALGVTKEELQAEADRLLQRPRSPANDVYSEVREPQPTFELMIGGRAKASPRDAYAYDYGEPDRVDMGWMFGPDTDALRVFGDSMTGYVESGQLVVFDRKRWPRKGEGCVVETAAGELYVKDYVSFDGKTLVLHQRFPDTEITFDKDEIKGVYVIRLRGD